MDSKQTTISVKWAVIILGIVAIIIGVSIAVRSFRTENSIIDFEDCKAAGGVILEMYPEQCRIYGASYINEAQVSPEQPTQGDDYVGLSESDAMSKAASDNTPARVVEREGEGLPVTMDFVFGRLNLYIRDDTVYKVEIEGQATDTN